MQPVGLEMGTWSTSGISDKGKVKKETQWAEVVVTIHFDTSWSRAGILRCSQQYVQEGIKPINNFTAKKKKKKEKTKNKNKLWLPRQSCAYRDFPTLHDDNKGVEIAVGTCEF